MNNIETFKEQLNQIKNQELRKLVEIQLNKIPEYFYRVPASSTSKYHNESENGVGGLVRHVKAVFKFAYCLLQLEMYAPLIQYRDEILVAALLHDSIKMGLTESKYTVFEHPKLAAESFKETAIEQNYKDMESIDRICGMICAHSGQWNTNRYSSIVLPKPLSKIEYFLHQCDYLGSRSFVQVSDLDNFERS